MGLFRDRVQQTTNTTGTGDIDLLSPPTGFQSFASFGNGASAAYAIAHPTRNEWEVGIGTVNTTGPKLARTTVLASSNSGSLVDFSAGNKSIVCALPAEFANTVSTIFNNSSNPTSGDGKDGDYWINTTTANFYGKAAGAWTLLFNMKGSTGSAGAGYAATSTTSNAIANSGSKSFTVAAGLAYAVGSRVRFTSIAAGDWMEGVVTAYSSTTLTATMDSKSGSGTHTDWTLSIAGQPGAAGAGSGTVTSISFAEGDGIDLSGSTTITSSGTLTISISAPTTTNLGGVKAINAVSGQFIESIDSSGTPILSSVDFSDLTGSLDPSQIPAPTLTTLGGVKAIAAVTTKFITSITTLGVPVLAQPAFTDISGTLAASQLPAPTTSNLGGVKAVNAVSHNFITSITTAGAPVLAQPAFADISGTIAPSQFPSNVGLTDGASIAWNLDTAPMASVTLGGNRTLANPTNMRDGGCYTLRVSQDGTGSRSLAFGSAYKWPGGSVPTLSTTANAIDILTFVSDGTNMYGTILKAFA